MSNILLLFLLFRVQLFVTPWTAARQVPLSFTMSLSLLIFMSTELVMPSNHFIFCCPLLLLHSIFLCIQSFSASRSFPMSRLFASDGQSSGTSALASVVPMNTQGWFPLGLTGWISLLSRDILQHHNSKASVLRHSAFFMVQLSHLYKYIVTWLNIVTWLKPCGLRVEGWPPKGQVCCI